MRRAAPWLAAALLLPLAAGGSTYDRGRGGAMVLYLLMQDLGYRASRLAGSPLPLEAGGVDLVFLLGDHEAPQAAALLRWVEAGGRLVLAAPLIDEGYCADLSIDRLKISRKTTLEGQKLAASDDKQLAIRRSACHLVPLASDKVLVGDRKLALAVQRQVGAGTVLLLAHEDLLSNRELNRDDLVVVLRRWVGQQIAPPAQIAFVEARRGGHFWEMLKRAKLVPMALHSMVFLLLLYWVLAPRFGESGGAPPARRRAFAEHARGLGHLYLGGNSSGYALRQQYERFLERIGGVRPGEESERDAVSRRRTTAALAATRSGRETEEVDRLLAEVEQATEKRAHDARELQRHLRLSQALADLQRKSGARTSGGKRGRTKVR
jgi:hypothetical protein